MPTKRTVQRRTFAQLRKAVWRSEKAALADLKRSGMPPSNEDHDLRETAPGRWQIVSRVMADPPGAREQRIIDSLKRKPGQKGRAEPDVVLEAKAPTAKVIPMRKRPQKATEAPAPSEGLEPVEAPAFVLEHPPEPPANPYAPLPSDDGPYELVLRSSDGTFPDNSVVAHAVTLSRRMRCNVAIRNGAGEIVREIDVAKITAAQRAAGGRGRPRNSGKPKATGKSAEAAKLLMRPQGATFAEVQAITEWGISERFVRRLGRARRMEPEQLGEKHWRLVKPS
jgi:hypothetical protein